MMTAIVACMCIINGPDFAILSRFNTILSTIGSSIIGSINIHTSAFWTRVGARLRLLYERGKIRNEEQFVRSIRDVLSGC